MPKKNYSLLITGQKQVRAFFYRLTDWEYHGLFPISLILSSEEAILIMIIQMSESMSTLISYQLPLQKHAIRILWI